LSIRVLAPHEAARIAAGEVIERPASVVKELIENALDAAARRISIEVRQGGTSLIRVSDDGEGIPASELRLAFERHATSKLPGEADLSSIATLGFRGEALPSVAAAAEVELVSRSPSATAGARIRVVGGQVVEEGAQGAPPGTTVTARHLFRRQPARLKFLRSTAAEGGQVASLVSQYALAYPEVRFTLRADGRLTLQTPGSGNLRDAAAAVYGGQVAASLLELSPLDGETATAAQEARVSGLVGPPEVSRANRSYVSLFVNRRWVRHRTLTYAVQEAYQGILPAGRYPLAILNIALPSEDVDVNVHPAKTEVRLRREREAFASVQRAVRRVLADHAPVPAWSGPAVSSESPGSGAAWPRTPMSGLPPSPLGQATPEVAAAVPAEAQRPLAARLPLLRPVGQVSNTYIIAEGPEGLYLIDQHAAHERVLYERFLVQQQEGRADVQGLLEPLPVELSPRQVASLEASADALAAQGLTLEPFGGSTYLVRSVPSCLAGSDIGRAVGELLDLLVGEEGAGERTRHVAASLACHAAVRAGQPLSDDEMRELIRALEEAEQPRTCPHGRPTMIHLSAEALARQFGRR
jgi:DNA mismatch repair protein MutL